MHISENDLKKLVLRILKELSGEDKQKLYMICLSVWNDQYEAFLKKMDEVELYCIYPVIPDEWIDGEYEKRLRTFKSCCGIISRSQRKPDDLDQSINLFPVTSRDILAKAALCISDTFETMWIESCIEAGARIVFWRSGLTKFSGKEKPAYINRILEYCRQVLEYGIEICDLEELWSDAPVEDSIPQAQEDKKRVITASNVQVLASEGVLYLKPNDIVTDMARDRARFLNIKLKQTDCEVTG